MLISLGPALKPDELLVPSVGSPHIASHVDNTPTVTPGIVVGGVDSLFNSPSPPSLQQQGHGGLGVGGHRKRKKSLPPSHPPSSSRASIVFPIPYGNPFTAPASQKKSDAEQGIGNVSFVLVMQENDKLNVNDSRTEKFRPSPVQYTYHPPPPPNVKCVSDESFKS